MAGGDPWPSVTVTATPVSDGWPLGPDRAERRQWLHWVWSSGCLGVPVFLLAPSSSDVGSPLDR